MIGRGAIGGGKLERGADDARLRRRIGAIGRRWRAGAAGKRRLGALVHMPVHTADGFFGARADLLARQRRVQREDELLFEQLLADGGAAMCIGDELRIDPGLVLINLGFEARDRGVERFAVAARQRIGGGHDHVVHDALEARILARVSLRVHRRDARRHELRACLHEGVIGDGAHAARGVAEALGGGREISRHQRVERIARRALICDRVPGVRFEHGVCPHDRARFVFEDRGVDLIGARERGAVDAAEIAERAFGVRDARAAAGGRNVCDPVIVAVIAELRCFGRVERDVAFDPILRERGKARVGGAGGLRRGGGRKGGRGQRSDHRTAGRCEKMLHGRGP